MSQLNPSDVVDQIIADILDIEPEDFDDEAAFGIDLETESLEYVEIAEMVEFELGVMIPDEKLEEIETVSHLKAYVVNNL